ncbi:hypothetical protein ACLOAU_18340 [Niabella sp. CJ426]|uniref:hypothetical protein n=1 Tax=Niabella sp. CJ426 TaxID=3393740 RepID=UPI003D03AB4B
MIRWLLNRKKKKKMQFRGGVIIVGSLLWEMTPEREKWRTLYLQMEQKTPVPVPIRYGRKSTSRMDTYTMIFSNHPSTKPGQAFIIELKDEIRSFRVLEKHAFAMAKAEGIWKDEITPIVNKRWGTVSLLINPQIDMKDKANADLIRNRWRKLYQTYSSFNPSIYNINSGDAPIIDQDGFLQLPWMEQMNNFDFLLTTPTVPDPHEALQPSAIANKMNDKNHWTYFNENIANGITTFQDDEIQALRP